MGGAAGTTPNAIHVLVTLRGVLRKVDASAEHATDVGMALIEPFVDDGVYERGSCLRWQTSQG